MTILFGAHYSHVLCFLVGGSANGNLRERRGGSGGGEGEGKGKEGEKRRKNKGDSAYVHAHTYHADLSTHKVWPCDTWF